MTRPQRLPLFALVLVVLVATGVVTSLQRATNPSQLPSGLAVSIDAESTALYCTGLAAPAARPGRVTFYNTSNSSRRLSVSVVSDTGHAVTSSLELAAHGAQSVEPSAVDQGHNFAVAALISGGGVVGEEIVGTRHAEVPCAAAGVTQWSATGFSTLVGSSAYLSVYNPTATAAVLNASIYTASGYSAPQLFQGLSIPAHAQREIDLGTEVVDTANVGVGVTVLRGSIVVVGVQDTHGQVSLDAGATRAAKVAWFPLVTTAQGASAQVRLANPTNQPAQLRLDVALGTYHVSAQTLSLAPFSTGSFIVTPNSAIPAAGFADLTLHSSEPVISALATGTSDWIALSSPVAPGNAFLIHDFAGLGFGAATVTNTSSRSLTLNVSTILRGSRRGATRPYAIDLTPGQSENLERAIPSFSGTPRATYLVTSSEPLMVVTLALPTRPPGLYVVAPLDGR